MTHIAPWFTSSRIRMHSSCAVRFTAVFPQWTTSSAAHSMSPQSKQLCSACMFNSRIDVCSVSQHWLVFKSALGTVRTARILAFKKRVGDVFWNLKLHTTSKTRCCKRDRDSKARTRSNVSVSRHVLRSIPNRRNATGLEITIISRRGFSSTILTRLVSEKKKNATLLTRDYERNRGTRRNVTKVRLIHVN